MTNRTGGRLNVNVASGTWVVEGFENLDNAIWLRLTGPLYPLTKGLPRRYRQIIERHRNAAATASVRRHDCRRRLPYQDGTVDHILCSHFLEHLKPDEMRRALGDFYRVLKPGGTIHVVLPDLALQIRRYVSGEIDADQLQREMILRREHESRKLRLLEAKGGFGLSHRWMYDEHTASKRLADAGFKLTDSEGSPSAEFRAGDESLHLWGAKE